MDYRPPQYRPQRQPDMPTYTGEPDPRPLLPCAECEKRIVERLVAITLLAIEGEPACR